MAYNPNYQAITIRDPTHNPVMRALPRVTQFSCSNPHCYWKHVQIIDGSEMAFTLQFTQFSRLFQDQAFEQRLLRTQEAKVPLHNYHQQTPKYCVIRALWSELGVPASWQSKINDTLN